jgi:hypothetical protein
MAKPVNLIKIVFFIVVLLFMIAIVLRLISFVQEPSSAISCGTNLKMIALATHMYTEDFNDQFPSGYQYLFHNDYVINLGLDVKHYDLRAGRPD